MSGYDNLYDIEEITAVIGSHDLDHFTQRQKVNSRLYEPIIEIDGDGYSSIREGTFLDLSEKKSNWTPRSTRKARKEEEDRTANKLLDGLTEQKNWNYEYQELLISTDTENKFNQLRYLAQDFLYVATLAAKIIISELFMEDHKKTILPINIGGFAGGEKYIYRNILFKFALDMELKENTGWMYGNDQVDDSAAMKVAKHELKGLVYYSSLRIPDLHFPLMVLIDYKGHRIIAESLLPINKATIKYGSSNGGESVHAEDDVLNDKMKQIGENINLLPHMIRGNLIYGPGDQEIHKGLDNRYYCIDLARVFPCEAPISALQGGDVNTRTVFYQLLRPEFVLKNIKPLSSDGFSRWGQMDENWMEHNREITKATQLLFDNVIPNVTIEIDALESRYSAGSLITLFEKIEPILMLHSHGINVRHIGRVRRLSESSRIRDMLLVESVSRVVKNIIKQELRHGMQKEKYLSDEQVKETIAYHFNFLLHDKDQEAMEFWKVVYNDLRIHFRMCLDENETISNVVHSLDIPLLFYRLQTGLGIKLSTETLQAMQGNTEDFAFVYCDVVDVFPKVKFMNILDEVEGESLLRMAMKKPRKESLRLLKLAASKFETACASLFNNFKAQFSWGLCLYRTAKAYSTYNTKYCENSETYYEFMLLAKDKFEFVLSMNNDDDYNYYKYMGNSLIALAICGTHKNNEKRFHNAANAYENAFRKDQSFLYKFCDKIEKLCKISITLDREDLADGAIYLCDRLYNCFIGDLKPSQQSEEENHLRASQPRSLEYMKIIYLWINIIREKINWLVKSVGDELVDEDRVRKGIDVMRYEILLREKYTIVLMSNHDSDASEESEKLFYKELPLLYTKSNHPKLLPILEQKLLKIQSVSFSYCNNIVNTIFPEFSPLMPNLVHLDLSSCTFLNRDVLVECAEYFPDLLYLNLSNCLCVDDECLTYLSQYFKKLEHLDLSKCNNIENEGLVDLIVANQDTILNLNLAGCRGIENESITKTFNLLKKLVVLNLDSCLQMSFLIGKAIRYSLFVNSLVHLNVLDYHQMGDVDLEIICSVCKKLNHIYFASKGLTDIGLMNFGNSKIIPNLLSLTIKGVRSHNKSFIPLMKNLSNIRQLSLRACMGLKDSSLAILANSTNTIRSLNLARCISLDGCGLLDLVKSCDSLASLDISYTTMDRVYIVEFLKMLNLKDLTLDGVSSLEDEDLEEFLPSHKWLKHLSLGSLNITDATISNLTMYNKKISRLGLESCLNLTDNVFQLFPLLKKLKYLNLTHCNVTVESFQLLKQNLLFLEKITF
eukprot:TRINITY_DN3633_c0_g2_i1.p1 TRINITY_DN3633_c0_g2~~TRINITY_DN3633_c0_g2_i1.p1  ORF type:complete len:1291 (+),score=227.82 TRINITY_DN3633_c0_g2_i1:61-3933(+)